jgi:hypothetical protein
MSRSTNRKADLYDVSTYTDDELYGILELDNNPSDRVLEAKILSMIEKYNRIGNAASDQMSQFFIDVYTHFFDVYDEAEDDPPTSNPKTIEGMANRNPKEKTKPKEECREKKQQKDEDWQKKATQQTSPLSQNIVLQYVRVRKAPFD